MIERAQEIAEFLNITLTAAEYRLARGFLYQHEQVANDFRRSHPRTDDELLNWYRTTTAYIWELSAYHMDQGFNYAGMCQGIAEHLRAAGVDTVLSLGDGIGDLSLTLHRAGFCAFYHDLRGSVTAQFAQHRFNRHDVPFLEDMSAGWNPEFKHSYDAVVSLDFLEHVTDVPAWVGAIYESLKPGGLLCAQNAFGIGSGDSGPMPMHLTRNDRYVQEWDPMLQVIGFRQESSNWYRKPQ